MSATDGYVQVSDPDAGPDGMPAYDGPAGDAAQVLMAGEYPAARYTSDDDEPQPGILTVGPKSASFTATPAT